MRTKLNHGQPMPSDTRAAYREDRYKTERPTDRLERMSRMLRNEPERYRTVVSYAHKTGRYSEVVR